MAKGTSRTFKTKLSFSSRFRPCKKSELEAALTWSQNINFKRLVEIRILELSEYVFVIVLLTSCCIYGPNIVEPFIFSDRFSNTVHLNCFFLDFNNLQLFLCIKQTRDAFTAVLSMNYSIEVNGEY